MKYVGAHVSASGGVENAPLNAKKSKNRNILSLISPSCSFNFYGVIDKPL
jgi:hypothetical protein